MIINTRNSVYRVQPNGNHFLITKLKAVNQSDYISVGECRKSNFADICIGLPAQFYGWRTSEVKSVELEVADAHKSQAATV